MKVLGSFGLENWVEFDHSKIAREEQRQVATELESDTFRVSGLTLSCPPGVYHPGLRSSSLFMLRHLDCANLPARPSVLEVGVGSGAVLLSLAARHNEGRFLGVDIDPNAVQTAASNAAHNHLDVEIRQSDLFSGLEDGELFDLILFNPPLYDKLPENDFERQALCDPDGQLLRRFLHQVPRFLDKGGTAFILVSNIGCLAPLSETRSNVEFVGGEIFGSGQLLVLIKLDELDGNPLMIEFRP